jgi:hypothetical protein
MIAEGITAEKIMLKFDYLNTETPLIYPIKMHTMLLDCRRLI